MRVKRYFLHHDLPSPKAEMQEGKAGRLQQPWDLYPQLVSSQVTATATSGVAIPQWGNTKHMWPQPEDGNTLDEFNKMTMCVP